jgi:uncharacterized membrane protein YhaH (DUF805 family)
MDALGVLVEEKKHRLNELLEYNKRVDQIIFLYLAAVYSALGFIVTGKVDPMSIYGKPETAYFVFLFMFLNDCLIVHGMSQSLWVLCLSKFVHIDVTNDMLDSIKQKGEALPASLSAWDDWQSGAKGSAVTSRGNAVFLWAILGEILSFASIFLINVSSFYSSHPYSCYVMVAILIAFQSYIIFLVFQLLHYARRFHDADDSIKGKTLTAFLASAILLSTVLILGVCWSALRYSSQNHPVKNSSATPVQIKMEESHMSSVNNQPGDIGPALTEFVARKDQVLNLETRLFVLVFAVQVAFVFLYFIWRDKLVAEKALGLLALLVMFSLFFEMIAIQGKMGLISTYLKQMEVFLASKGYSGLVWETRALKEIIFVPANAFTLPAGLAILTLFAEAGYCVYFSLRLFIQSKVMATAALIVICVFLAFVLLKAATLDFGKVVPNVFR